MPLFMAFDRCADLTQIIYDLAHRRARSCTSLIVIHSTEVSQDWWQGTAMKFKLTAKGKHLTFDVLLHNC